MTQQKVPIDQLCVGMFIEELDISYINSPFMRTKRKLQNKKEIALLKKAGVKLVTINTEKSDIDDKKDAEVETQEAILDSGNQVEEVVTKETNLFKERYQAAKKLQGQVTQVLDTIADDILNDGAVKQEAFAPIIKDSIKLIDHNNQSLLALLQAQRRNKHIQAHSFSVMSMAIGLADQLKLPDELIVALATAGLLHECGWNKLPLNLFLKGKSYTEKERDLANQHIPIIINILKNSPGINLAVLRIIIPHHSVFSSQESFDVATEKGVAQILAIANYYDASIHGIGEQQAKIPALAIRGLLEKGRQGYFQMELVTSFIKYIGIYPIGSAVRLSDNSLGVVVDSNKAKPTQPMIRIWYDSQGKNLNMPKKILPESEGLSVSEPVNPAIGNLDPFNLLHLDSE